MSRRSGRPRRVRRSVVGRAEPQDDRVRLRARGAPDLLALIPFQLGFHPEESLVAVFVRGRTIALVARVDLPPVAAAAGFAGELGELARQNRAQEIVFLAYSEHPGPARAVLSGLIEALPSGLVRDALYVDGSRWWSLTCDDSCCPGEGTPYDIETHRLAAEAVFAGLTTLGSRKDLAATVAGPPETEVPRLVGLAAEIRATGGGPATGEDPAPVLLRRVRSALADPEGLDDRACTELALLVEDIRLRDLVWAMIEPEAEQHLVVWQRVVSRVAPPLSAAPLALLGLASWISGHGALLNCATEELSRRHPSYTMGHLLEEISARAISPRLWQSLGGDVHAELREELARLSGCGGLPLGCPP
jgi:uncharacterized protein DUF4192